MSRYNRNQQTKSSITAGQTNGSELTHTWMSIPSSNQPIFGTPCLIDYRENSNIIHEAIIVFNISSITGLTGTASNCPRFVPAYNFSQRSEIVFGANSIDTIYGVQNQINCNLWNNDDDRLFINQSAGMYSNPTQRFNLAATTSTYYAPLFSLFNQLNISPVNGSHSFQLRLNLDSLANLVEKGTLTGTPTCTINSVSLMLRISKLDQLSITNRLNNLRLEGPGSAYFNQTIYQPIQLNSGILTSSTVLSAFANSDVQHIYFVIRPTSIALTGDAIFAFASVVKDFCIVGGSGEIISSASVLPASFVLNTLNRHSTKGSYCSEHSYGSVNDNKANIFAWYFNLNAVATSNDGVPRGSKKFIGNESLVINYITALATTYQIDVFGSATAIFQQSLDGCKKLTTV